MSKSIYNLYKYDIITIREQGNHKSGCQGCLIHISPSEVEMCICYLRIIITIAIIKVNAIIVTAISAVKSKKIICNKVCSIISITSLL